MSDRSSRLRLTSTLAALLLGLTLLPLLVVAEGEGARRSALVIGISEYDRDAGLQPLPKARTDAKSVAQALQALGYKVEMHLDPTLRDLQQRMGDFEIQHRQDDFRIIYIAAHAVRDPRHRDVFVLPRDWKPRTASQAVDRRALTDQAYNITEQIEAFGPYENKVKGDTLFLLDMCNQTPKQLTVPREPPVVVKGWSQPRVLALYAAAPGQQALAARFDENGLFTKHLLREMQRPKLSVHNLVENVARAVRSEMRKGDKGQVVWSEGSPLDDVCISTLPGATC